MPAPQRQAAVDASGYTFRQTLAALPLTNIGPAQEALRALIEDMYREPPPAGEFLTILELAGKPLAFLQEALAGRYLGRPLPPSEAEDALFRRVVGLWRLVADSYGRLVGLAETDEALRPHLALICQRCLHFQGQAMLEHYQARRSLPAGYWRQLHRYYASAEALGVTAEPVASRFGSGSKNASCAVSYGAVVLVDLANPYSRSPRGLSAIFNWARKLAAYATVVPPDEDAGGCGYGLDFAQDQGPRPVELLAATATARLFDTSQIKRRVRRVLAKLKEGSSPAELGLGKEWSANDAGRLLLQLYRPWCLAAMPRRFERAHTEGSLAVAYGAERIYYFVTEREFLQPAPARTFSRAEADRLWTFRDQLEPDRPLHLRVAQLGHRADPWEIADQSVNGFRVRRGADGPRIEHGQLLAVQPPGLGHFLLARVSWLMRQDDGGLQAGIQLLPGRPQGVALRPATGVAHMGKFQPAFALPAVRTLGEPVSLVMPRGWFQPGRILELYDEGQIRIQLTKLFSAGADFERCGFMTV